MKGWLSEFRAAFKFVPLSLEAMLFTNQGSGEGGRLLKATQGTPTAGGAAVGPGGTQRGGEEHPGALQGPATPPAVNFLLPPPPDLKHLLLPCKCLLQMF